MISGFAIAYRDNNGYPVLYFYPGYDDNLNKIYADIDLSSLHQEYDWKRNDDGSIKCVFENKKIKNISCKLFNNITKETKQLSFDI